MSWSLLYRLGSGRGPGKQARLVWLLWRREVSQKATEVVLIPTVREPTRVSTII